MYALAQGIILGMALGLITGLGISEAEYRQCRKMLPEVYLEDPISKQAQLEYCANLFKPGTTTAF